jgi:peptide/nickel transport system substrate-binding protein
LFFVFLGIFLISGVSILWTINKSFLVKVPTYGGSIHEGIVGTPRFINPLLAISDADRDMTALTYSGLLRKTQNGDLINDLAEKYEISEDELTYTFTLKDDIYFHDNTKITSDDVVFTIEKAQDSTIKSPKRASWDGVLVEKIDDKTVSFTLNSPYSLFLGNTTLGILPKHIWDKIDVEQFSFSDYNIKPIGSGPYKISGLKKNSSGIPKYYDLSTFDKWSLEKPFISKLRIQFYSNEKSLVNALEKNEIESANAISPKIVQRLSSNNKYKIIQAPLPRVFAIFFNQSQASILTDKSVRKALDVSLDKTRIINDVLYGYGTKISSPIPPGSIGYKKTDSETLTDPERIEKAKSILAKDGWTKNKDDGIMEKKTKKSNLRLEFSISTSDIPELKDTAQIIKEEWRKIGVDVDVKVFKPTDLNQNIIRPRKYDAILFGEIIGHDPDLFAFWHSSQRNDPGLNIALYANIAVDKLLTKARKTLNIEDKISYYKKFQDEIESDIPAVFIYTPDFVYVLPKKIKGVEIGSVTTPSERFLDIQNWFIETNNIWNFFIKK